MKWPIKKTYWQQSDCDNYRVSKAYDGKKWQYSLWKRGNGWECVNVYPTADDARKEARKLREGAAVSTSGIEREASESVE